MSENIEQLEEELQAAKAAEAEQIRHNDLHARFKELMKNNVAVVATYPEDTRHWGHKHREICEGNHDLDAFEAEILKMETAVNNLYMEEAAKKQAKIDAKESANSKLKALGLTDEEIAALRG